MCSDSSHAGVETDPGDWYDWDGGGGGENDEVDDDDDDGCVDGSPQELCLPCLGHQYPIELWVL